MSTPAGWYDDGRGAVRWWDGRQWTEHVPAPDASAPAVADDASTAAQPAIEPAEGDLTAEAEPSPQPADTSRVSAPRDSPPAATELDPAAALGFAEPAPAVSPTYPPSGVAPTAGAFPVGYPAQAGSYAGQPGGDPAVATQQASPKRSLWWVWLVAGGALLVILIVLVVIFVPMAIRAVMGGGVEGDTEAERAAIATVQTYDRAWQSIDCDLMVSATTEGFREDYDLATCETFEAQADELATTTSEYETTITSAQTQDDGTVIVETTETYEDSADGAPYADYFAYLVVSEDDGWRIDDFDVDE